MPGVYRTVMGEAYKELSEPLQRLHDAPFASVGFMQVTGKSFAPLFGLPAPGMYRLEIEVTGDAAQEIWTRTFIRFSNGKRTSWKKRTRQLAREGFLEERVGPLRFLFRLSCRNGFLVFDQIGCRLGRVPIPFAIKIWAIEMDSGDQFAPLVSFWLPVLGHICTYAGSIPYTWKSPSGSS